MADEKRLKYLLLGEDRSAGRTLDQVGTKAGKTGGILSGLGGKIKGGLIAMAASIAVGEVIDFGKAAVDASQDAEKSQRALEDAYKRFPALQDVTIAKLREQAAAIQAKTGADADDIAASQAVLARYKLKGSELQKLTPLMVDYAKRTGKSMPAAAATLGKAMMGNGRGLKELGIKFKDTGDPAKNLEQIMSGLRKTVGGFAEKEATSLAGKTEIAQARMGEFQESIGGKLEPIMNKLLDTGMAVLDWLDANPAVIEAASSAFDGLVGVIEWLASTLGSILQPLLVSNIKLFAFLTAKVADMLDALGNVPGFEWAKGAAATLRKVSQGADAVADGIANIGKKKVTVNTGQGEKSVASLRKKIDGIKGKIATARVKGDTKEVDRLNKKLRDMRKSYQVLVRARMTGSGRVVVTPHRGGNMVMRAFAKGGRPKVGELAMFHANEIWAPDTAGTVYTAAQSRRMLGNGPGSIGGGGDVINIYVSGDTDPDAAVRRIERKLAERKKRKGRLDFQ